MSKASNPKQPGRGTARIGSIEIVFEGDPEKFGALVGEAIAAALAPFNQFVRDVQSSSPASSSTAGSQRRDDAGE